MKNPTQQLLLASSISLVLLSMSGAALSQTVSSDVVNARQEAQIETTYALSPYLRAHDIDVVVVEGKATLTGIVDEDVNKDLARQIALGVPGITSVDNNLVVNADHTPPTRARTDGERSFGAIVDDASITAAIKSKLLWSRYTDGLDTTVETLDGVVTLTGTADSGEAKELANMLARDTRGVTKVDNRLTVDPSANRSSENRVSATSTSQAISDTWITTKVKSTYLMSSNIHSGDISVSTSQGNVTLSGVVQSGAESALAIELAQNINGVKSVDSKDLKF